jgi:hypothetical protein
MALDSDIEAAGWVSAFLSVMCGAVYWVFTFISGTRTELRSHAVKLSEHDIRFGRVEDALTTRFERLEAKMDTQHTQLTAVILGLARDHNRE